MLNGSMLVSQKRTCGIHCPTSSGMFVSEVTKDRNLYSFRKKYNVIVDKGRLKMNEPDIKRDLDVFHTS